MTHDDVQAWLDRYIAAWASYDPAAIGDLFTDDARYRFHPSDEGFLGREARYYTDASKSTVQSVWDNVYLLEFGPDRRCRSFAEWYVERPEDRR
jgi:hypothetical protein